MSDRALSRRNLMLTALAASTSLAAGPPARALDIDRLGEPLGAQALAIRSFLVRDFVGTMRVLRTMGYGQIELVSFPGIAGNFRGDFGPITQMRPADIARDIRSAGLTCTSSHFLAPEFEAANWSRTSDWARGVGIRNMVFTDGHLPSNPSADDVKRFAAELNAAGERARAAGMQMSLHTLAALWAPLGQGIVADVVFAEVDAAHCQIQLDLGSVMQASADGAALIDRFARRITSIHLRDGKKPTDPTAYFPALPLGEGEVDWVKVMTAARRAGIRQYIVEMQLRPVFGMLDGHKTSVDYLRALKI